MVSPTPTTPPALDFAPGTPADTTELLALWRRSVEATHDFLSSRDIGRLEAMIRDVYLGAVSLTVARHDGVALGFVGTSGGEGAEPLSIEMLFVDPASHGRGVGTALLERVARGHARVLVDVNEQNPKAAGFYARLGFEAVGRSETDGEGAPFPLLHLRRDTAATPSGEGDGAN